MASNDPPTVATVEHSEGASYVVDFGDPLRYPLPGDTADPNGGRALAYTNGRIPPYAPHAGAYLVFF